jgi:uncharacterized membrane protein
VKRVIFFILGLLFLLLPHTVWADEGWVIERFNSDIKVQKTGEVLITENIDVDFNTLSKHGIFRDIPYVYELDGVKTYTEINVQHVLQNDKKAKFSQSLTDGYVRLKIGDADKTITGKNKYEITYIARGVLRGFEDHDELYWNVTGNNWPVSISSATSTIRLPGDGIIELACFQGYSGQAELCRPQVDTERLARFESDGVLDESQGMTIAASYTKGLVPILHIEKPKSFWEKLIDWPSLTTIFALILFGAGTTFYLWNKNGRDYWFGQGVFGKKDDLGSVKPHVAHETTVVEYTPPEKLRPAEIGVLFDEKADTLDVVSTIIDLATRGFLTITEIDKKWVFGKVDYLLTKKEKDQAGLVGYEKMLLSELFQGSSEVKISSLKQTFYDELKKIKEELYKEVVTKGLFPKDPEKVRTKYFALSFVMIFVGLFAIGYTIGFGNVILADLCLGLTFSGFILLLTARHMPRRSAYGRDLYRRIKGYRLFIEKAETHRQKFFEKKNLFNEVLPYAIVFGLTGKFAAAMEEMGIKPSNTGWYSGSRPFSMGSFESSMSGFSSSMSSAIASTPSSSGGFSSSGGSGGGFGGGGGGSW